MFVCIWRRFGHSENMAKPTPQDAAVQNENTVS